MLIQNKIKVSFVLSWHWNVIVDSAAPNKEIRKYHCSAQGWSPCSCAAVYVTVWLKQNVWLAKWCYHARALSCKNKMGLILLLKKKANKHLCWTLLSLFYRTWYTKKKKKKVLVASSVWEFVLSLAGARVRGSLSSVRLYLVIIWRRHFFLPPLPLCCAFSETGNYLVRLAKWRPCTTQQDIAHDDDGD